MVRPVYWILWALARLSSAGLIGRDASLISISPRPNFLKPPPVPERATEIFISGLDLRNSSATASVIGYTVLEPSIWIWPLASFVSVCWLPPQAASSITNRPAIAERKNIFIFMSGWIVLYRVGKMQLIRKAGYQKAMPVYMACSNFAAKLL